MSLSSTYGPPKQTARALRRVMMVRTAFAGLLFGSTLFFQIGEGLSPLETPLAQLYGLIIAIFGLNLVYSIWLQRTEASSRVAIVQAMGDTIIVTTIIAFTGGFSSVFTFLYLVVIIYSSLLLSRATAAVVAIACSVQFGMVTLLENLAFFRPFYLGSPPMSATFPLGQVVYHVAVICIACLGVAALSVVLVEQNRKSSHDLILLEEHVKRVEKMASMGEMAAGMAHEIKNPLASLAGSIQLLREDIPFNPYHDRLMQIVLRETDRLSVLVNNFLMFAKPPAGRIADVDLGEAIREILILFKQDDTRGERISLEADLAKSARIAIDQNHLQQVIWNLLVNAAESIEGPGQIRLALQYGRPNEVVLVISDTGCGMTEESIHSIFNPFFTTKHNGTGLGLSVVHSLLGAYQARIDVDSTPGEGTIFTVTFQRVTEYDDRKSMTA